MVGIPLNGITRQHLCVCPNLGPEFPSDYIVDLFVFNGLYVRGNCSLC
jgi:hypothetical protein